MGLEFQMLRSLERVAVTPVAQVLIIDPADESDSEDGAAGSDTSESSGLNKRAFAELFSHARYATPGDAGLQVGKRDAPSCEARG